MKGSQKLKLTKLSVKEQISFLQLFDFSIANTLRTIIHLSAGQGAISLHFPNLFGHETLPVEHPLDL